MPADTPTTRRTKRRSARPDHNSDETGRRSHCSILDFSNLTAHGGFFPHGVGTVFGAISVVIAAMVGAEVATIAAAETVAASARHRGAVLGETDPVARVVDLGTVIAVLRGKLEFESGEEGREQAVLEHLLRRATADTASRALGGLDVGPLVAAVEGGSAVTTGERVSAKNVLAALPDLPIIEAIAKRLGAESEGERAAALELALEALYLAKRVDKVSGEGETVYG